MFTYSAFIDDLRVLAGQVPALRQAKDLHDDPSFRRWRHELSDLIERIQALGYSINCDVSYRNFDEFGTYSYSPTYRDRVARFQQDLNDTLVEIETLITTFQKFGDPRPPLPANKAPTSQSDSPQPTTLKLPENVTASWLWHNAPLSFWLQVGSAAFALVALGIYLGQSALYAEVVAKLRPATAPAAAAASQPSPAVAQ